MLEQEHILLESVMPYSMITRIVVLPDTICFYVFVHIRIECRVWYCCIMAVQINSTTTQPMHAVSHEKRKRVMKQFCMLSDRGGDFYAQSNAITSLAFISAVETRDNPREKV